MKDNIRLMLIRASGIAALLLFVFAITISCGTNVDITQPDLTDSLDMAFGTESTFDLITWNIENFPKRAPDTSNLLRSIIPNLQAECIAIQEVRNTGELYGLINQMPGWSYAISNSGDTKTALLYNTETVTVDSTASLFNGMSNPFPRSPLLVRLSWRGNSIIVISLHLKAFGDDYIDENDPYDEEVRRRYACQLIDDYIRTYHADEKVIVCGDMNDQIQEPETSNVFMPFLSRPQEYLFTDMAIAQNYTNQTCSYPGYTSHIDHILISNELFAPYGASGYYTQTLRIENYIVGGWTSYYRYISDHRPVGSRFLFLEK